MNGVSWGRRLGITILALLACCVAFLTFLVAAGRGSEFRALFVPATVTPAATRVVVLAPMPLPATPGTINGAGIRIHLYPHDQRLDFTLGGGQAPQPRHARRAPSILPDARYAAEDTLTGTGPGPPGPLSGLPTRPLLANRRSVAVVIDNYGPDARPQTGLNRASLVFETLAEGGITRFMAVYLEKDAPVVGPVRSARIYFDAWAAGLHAIYAHAGGNNDALHELPGLHTLTNVDGLLSTAFWRSSDRAAPHNLYVDTGSIRPASGASNDVPILQHKEPAAPRSRPGGGSIEIDFSEPEYSVHYRYAAGCNCYPRAMGGEPHRDAYSGRQIAPSNVVVLYAGVTPDLASDTPGSINVQSRGTGRALYFRDGTLVSGFWHKAAAAAPLSLQDAAGQPVALNPGQTWIEVVPIGAPVRWSLS